jgi:serine kinase of HPr protein (carbohydrate metabolism regulator)
VDAPQTIHATTIVLGEAGILIRGESGAGKSTFARHLIAAAASRGIFARLVADDRSRIEQRHGRLLARGVEAIAGLIEIRGIGLVRQEVEPAAVVGLIVDLSETRPERLPEPDDLTATLCGISLPRLRASAGTDLTDIVLARASGLYAAVMTE